MRSLNRLIGNQHRSLHTERFANIRHWFVALTAEFSEQTGVTARDFNEVEFFLPTALNQVLFRCSHCERILLSVVQQVQYAKTGATAKDFNKVYFMPTASDRFVIGFRQWLSKFGHGDVQYAAGVDPKIPLEVLPKEVRL